MENLPSVSSSAFIFITALIFDSAGRSVVGEGERKFKNNKTKTVELIILESLLLDTKYSIRIKDLTFKQSSSLLEEKKIIAAFAAIIQITKVYEKYYIAKTLSPFS